MLFRFVSRSGACNARGQGPLPSQWSLLSCCSRSLHWAALPESSGLTWPKPTATGAMSSKADQKILRTLLQTQTGKIGAKNEEDVALLASVADYFEKRAKIEADYGKALEKLARTHMERNNRRPPFGTISRAGSLLGLPGLGQPKADNMAPPSPDGFENDGATAQTTRSTHDAFLQFLRESERQADCRVKLAESLVKDISEVVKLYTPRKQSVAKKVCRCAFGVPSKLPF